MMHSYWAPDRPHLLEGVTTGIAMCGERAVPRKQLTCAKQQITCKTCREKHKTYGDGLGIPEFMKRDKNEAPRSGPSATRTALIEERRHRFDKPMSLTDEEYDRLKSQFDRGTTATRAVREPGGSQDPAGPQAPSSPRQARPARSHSPNPKGKAGDIVALMRRPGGVTREEVLKAMGWQAVSMQQQAAQCGVELKIDKSRKPYRYSVKE